jgi:hypothetical protein
MKNKISLLSVFLLFFAPKLFAFGCEEVGSFNVEAEWLYFRPSVDTQLFSTNGTFGAIGSTNKSLGIVPPYHSGWRLGAGYMFCDCQDRLAIRWSQLNTQDAKHFFKKEFQSLDIGVSPALFAKDTFQFNYYAFEAIYAHSLKKGRCYFAELIAGIQYAWLGIDEKVDFISTVGPNQIKQAGHFWGIGPEFGLDFGINLYRSLTFIGSGTGSLLASRVHEKVHIINAGPSIINNTTTPIWRIVPTFDFRAGLRYDHPLSCMNFFIEAGYEFISYVRGLRLMNVTINTGSFQYSNGDMHGPYIAFGTTF